MADAIDGLRALRASQPRPEGWAARRSRMDEVCAGDGVPKNVAFTPLTLAGCPAEWSQAPGGRADRAVLFLHGGGYCSGSLASHRTMAGGLARAAGLRVLAFGYRLAAAYLAGRDPPDPPLWPACRRS